MFLVVGARGLPLVGFSLEEESPDLRSGVGGSDRLDKVADGVGAEGESHRQSLELEARVSTRGS